MRFRKHNRNGFTILEILVVCAIIGMLASVVLFSADQARKQSRDNKRKADLKQLQLAIELYAQEHGEYPDRGCGITGNNQWAGPENPATNFNVCDDWISGLAPEYVPELPTDPRPGSAGSDGYWYITIDADSDGKNEGYKVMARHTVETFEVPDRDALFARFPTVCLSIDPNAYVHDPITYAVYSEKGACL